MERRDAKTQRKHTEIFLRSVCGSEQAMIATPSPGLKEETPSKSVNLYESQMNQNEKNMRDLLCASASLRSYV